MSRVKGAKSLMIKKWVKSICPKRFEKFEFCRTNGAVSATPNPTANPDYLQSIDKVTAIGKTKLSFACQWTGDCDTNFCSCKSFCDFTGLRNSLTNKRIENERLCISGIRHQKKMVFAKNWVERG